MKNPLKGRVCLPKLPAGALLGFFMMFSTLSFAADKGELWSLQPIQRVSPPSVQNKSWSRDSIDSFVLARMEKGGLEPVADAKPATLARRLYFNLIGLPPTPEQLDVFVSAAKKNRNAAIEVLVDELLDSPRFGEKWGRHWLDLARYSESNGKDRDVVFPNAWRYRDYVISSLNADKSYFQFVKEQIAGDLLDATSESIRDERLVATTFLTLAPKAFQETDMEKFTMDVVDEQIDVVSRSVLAMTIACARCHDHKFDAISTKDYYAIAGIFLSSDTRYGPGPLYNNNHDKDTLLVAIGPDVERLHPEVAKWQAEVIRLTEAVTKGRSDAYRIKRKVAGALRDRGLKDPKEDPELAKMAKEQEALTVKATAWNEERKILIQSPPAEKPGYTMAVLESEESPEDCKVRVRGMPKEYGDAVLRGKMSIPGMPELGKIGAHESGRRQLAEWLVNEKNPLTSRVMVNRVWRHLFGQGLVRTVDNFGVTGDNPSHPELLDTLAADFVATNGSIKKLIRRIVLSRTWQLGSEDYDKGQELDPDNYLLWRANFRRLDIEPFRDAVLMVSGQLQIEPPAGSLMMNVFPGAGYRGTEVKKTDVDNVNMNQEITQDRHRTIFLPVVRNQMPEVLKLFDFADPNAVLGSRNARTIPSQALYLMNSPFVEAQSRHAAGQVIAFSDSIDHRIDRAYRMTQGEEPTPSARLRAKEYIKQRVNEDEELDAWSDFMASLYASASFRYLK